MCISSLICFIRFTGVVGIVVVDAGGGAVRRCAAVLRVTAVGVKGRGAGSGVVLGVFRIVAGRTIDFRKIDLGIATVISIKWSRVGSGAGEA